MKDPKVKTKVKEITPQWAERVLAEHQRRIEAGEFRNRPVTKAIVDAYAADMARGKWGLTHQGIGFDVNGNLVDGQKRLWAVVKTGKTITMNVTTGLPAQNNSDICVMDLIDSGQKRSIGQQLAISHGVASAPQVAAVVRNIAYVYTNDKHVKLSTTQTLEIMDMYRSSIDALFALTTHKQQRVGPILGPLAVYHSVEPAKAREFASSFFTKEALLKGSPVLALIKWIEQHPGYGGKDTVFQKLRTVSYCIHQYHHQTEADNAAPREEAMYWLAALNKKHGEIIRAMIYPLKNK